MRTNAAAACLADHRTPLIRNQWYVAALTEEVGETLTERRILDQNLVFFRKADGAPVALQNRCPHRSFPLSKGHRVGDTIVCGYHGMTFDASGRCVRIPSQRVVPSAVRTRSYPLIERSPVIWIWMGKEDEADPAFIPDISWFGDTAYQYVTGLFHVPSSYVRLHENLLDLTHVPFLHGGMFDDLVGDAIEFSSIERRIEEKGNRVGAFFDTTIRGANTLWFHPENFEGPDKWFFDPQHRVAQRIGGWFESPAVQATGTVYEDLELEPGEKVARTHIMHALTPETATSTHYFWVSANDVNVGKADASARLKRDLEAVIMQDVVGLQYVEEAWARDSDIDYREISVRADRPGIVMRRILWRLAQQESRAAAT